MDRRYATKLFKVSAANLFKCVNAEKLCCKIGKEMELIMQSRQFCPRYSNIVASLAISSFRELTTMHFFSGLLSHTSSQMTQSSCLNHPREIPVYWVESFWSVDESRNLTASIILLLK